MIDVKDVKEDAPVAMQEGEITIIVEKFLTTLYQLDTRS